MLVGVGQNWRVASAPGVSRAGMMDRASAAVRRRTEAGLRAVEWCAELAGRVDVVGTASHGTIGGVLHGGNATKLAHKTTPPIVLVPRRSSKRSQ